MILSKYEDYHLDLFSHSPAIMIGSMTKKKFVKEMLKEYE